MGSRWNRWHEALLRSDLKHEELRLGVALGREILGWNETSRRVSDRRLRDLARLHGRSLDRAREGLVEKGLVRHTPGTVGRGGAGMYELGLDGEMPAPARANPPSEMPARQRSNHADVNARSDGREMPAGERARIGSKGKTRRPDGRTPTLPARAIDAYLAAGGSLELSDWKGALVRQATSLVQKGAAEATVLAAVSVLGREREFPGHLTQRVRAYETNGLPCRWQEIGHTRLSPAQLAECGCPLCERWSAALAEASLS